MTNETELYGEAWKSELRKWNKTQLIEFMREAMMAKDAKIEELEAKYNKCINVIWRFDAGIIGMYDL